MSSSLRLSLLVQAHDHACKPRSSGESIRDACETTHDLIDLAPVKLTTASQPGAVFETVRHEVAQVERLIVEFASGTDAWLRLGGSEAVRFGGSTSPVFVGGEDLELVVDGVAINVEFEASDATLALAVKRINYAAGAPVASLESGRLVLRGSRSGDAGATARGTAFGAVEVVSGSAMSQLGLSAGATYGSGTDLRVSAGMLVLSFPPGALPSRIELSGHVPSAKFTIAGKAA